MGELVIQYHEFENAKNELKKFSEQTTTDLDLKRVDSSKGVGEFLSDWFFGRGIGKDHVVKGDELNDLSSQIQTHLHCINNTQIKLIKEFGQVYGALEALDKDYIQAILISIKATEETSEGIQRTQEQIKKIVENQRKTLEELKRFKQKLDCYTHLGDIDILWDDYQKWHKDIASLTYEISTAKEHSNDNFEKIEALKTALTVTEKEIKDLSTHFSQLIERLESVTAFTRALERITHLQDVDEMWDSLAIAHNSLSNISSNIEVLQKGSDKHQEDINNILAFVEETSSLEHLTDVDKLWSNVEEQTLHLKDIDRINDEQAGYLKSLSSENSKTADRVSANENSIEKLNERINSQVIERLESVTTFTSALEKIVHLRDVDEIWESLATANSSLDNISSNIEALQKGQDKHQEDINNILAFVEKVSTLEHLMDADKLWSNVEEQKLHLKDIDRVNDEHASYLKSLSSENSKIADRVSANENSIEILNERINSQVIERLESVTAFTSALEKIVHLQDIDEIWESLATAHGSLDNISSNLEALQKGADKHQEDINNILAFVENVSTLEHLMDTDKLWSNVEEQKLHLKDIDRTNDEHAGYLKSLSSENSKIADRVSANENSIEKLNDSIKRINGMVHLEDIDSTWNTVKEHSEQLTSLETQNEAIATSVQKNKEYVEDKIVEANNIIASLSQKLKYTYFIGGGAAGLAIIELILLLVLR